MNSVLLFMLACESPVPLPPKTHTATPVDARMVQMDTLRGYLQQPVGNNDTTGIILVSDKINQASRSKAKAYPMSTVIVVDSMESVAQAKTYLQGMNGVRDIQVVCIHDDCTPLNDAP